MPFSLFTSWIATSASAGHPASIREETTRSPTAEVRVLANSCIIMFMSVLHRVGGQQETRHGMVARQIFGSDLLDIGGRHLLDAVRPFLDILHRAAGGERRAVEVRHRCLVVAGEDHRAQEAV